MFRVEGTSALKMEAEHFSKALVTNYLNAWCHNLQDDSLGE
jgi:hypothetical protein